MLIGYRLVSMYEDSQSAFRQRDALIAAGVSPSQIHEDTIWSLLDARPGLCSALKALHEGDTLIVWKLDRLGRNLRHLVDTVHDLTNRGIGIQVLSGHGASIDTMTSGAHLIVDIFAALAEFERDLVSQRTKAGLARARARGRKGGAPFKMTTAKLRLARVAMAQPDTKVGDLCRELRISRQTLYRHVGPDGALRDDGERLLKTKQF
jgi:DNA invertase Pin-like site-specific DNA recombinase